MEIELSTNLDLGLWIFQRELSLLWLLKILISVFRLFKICGIVIFQKSLSLLMRLSKKLESIFVHKPNLPTSKLWLHAKIVRWGNIFHVSYDFRDLHRTIRETAFVLKEKVLRNREKGNLINKKKTNSFLMNFVLQRFLLFLLLILECKVFRSIKMSLQINSNGYPIQTSKS